MLHNFIGPCFWKLAPTFSACIYWVQAVTMSIGKSDGRVQSPVTTLAKRRRLNKNLPCRTRLLVTGRHSWRQLQTDVTEVDVHFGSCLGVNTGRPGHHLKQRVSSMTRFWAYSFSTITGPNAISPLNWDPCAARLKETSLN